MQRKGSAAGDILLRRLRTRGPGSVRLRKRKQISIDLDLFRLIEKLSRRQERIAQRLKELRATALEMVLAHGGLITIENAAYKTRTSIDWEFSKEVAVLENTMTLLKRRIADRKALEITMGLAKKAGEKYQLVREKCACEL